MQYSFNLKTKDGRSARLTIEADSHEEAFQSICNWMPAGSEVYRDKGYIEYVPWSTDTDDPIVYCGQCLNFMHECKCGEE